MKIKLIISALLALSMSSSAMVFAQADKKSKDCCEGAPQMSKEMQEAFERVASVNENHKLLKFMVGEWKAKSKFYWAPDKPPEVTEGKSVTKAIMDGRFFQSNYSATMMGKPFKGMSVSGYDNVSKKFTSSWIDNFTTHMLMSTGTYDPKTKTFTYTGTTSDCMDPSKTVGIKEVIKIVDKDKHTFEMYEKKDGKETKTIEITYVRESAEG